MSRDGRGFLAWKLVVAVALAVATSGAARGAECSKRSARLVARAYVMASPIAFEPEAFFSFLAENKESFGKRGSATRCMKALADKLLHEALAKPASPQRDYATERFGGSMPPGLEHLPGQVDASMRSATDDTFTMALELLWLAKVLPAAADEDLGPFLAQDTPARQMWQQVLPMINFMCANDEGVCQYFVATLLEYLPLMEQQIYALAVQV
jgi:hypothetical protein